MELGHDLMDGYGFGNTMGCHDMGLDLLDGKKTEILRH